MKTHVTLCLMMILSAVNAFTQAPRKPRRSTPQPTVSRTADFGKFIGMWEYAPDSLQKKYFTVNEERPGRFKFVEGFEYNGNITWAQTMVNHADGIYLKPLNGKLVGRFTSPNFRATHGYDIDYRITLALESGDKLLYSVSSELEPERYSATKVNNGADTDEGITSNDQVADQATSKAITKPPTASVIARKRLAEKSWQPFWAKFSKAIYTKDFKTLEQLSSADFFDAGGDTPKFWFEVLMADKWNLVKKAVMSGTRPLEMDDRKDIERITIKYGDMIFRFEKDNKWRFVGVMGD
jgi:hypothetical protein